MTAPRSHQLWDYSHREQPFRVLWTHNPEAGLYDAWIERDDRLDWQHIASEPTMAALTEAAAAYVTEHLSPLKSGFRAG